MNTLASIQKDGWRGRLRSVAAQVWAHCVTCRWGFLLVLGIGTALLMGRIGDPLARWSYDVPFLFHSRVQVSQPPVVLVYVNDSSLKALSSTGPVLDRKFHSQFLEKLADERAKLVFYDFNLSSPSLDPKIDEQFARAMRRHGTVVLGESWDNERRAQGIIDAVHAPLPLFRTNGALASGLTDFDPLDPDGVVRLIPAWTSQSTSAVWKIAEILQSPVTRATGQGGLSMWLNYYGPPDSGKFPVYGFDQALRDGLPSDFFRGKIVVIGGHHTAGPINSLRDTFLTPYSRFGAKDAAGAEIHATALVNLLNHDWLTQLPTPLQYGFVWAYGAFIVLLLASRHRRRRIWIMIAAIIALTLVSFLLQWYLRLWWPWAIPALIQTPLAFAWAWFQKNPPIPIAFISYRREGGADVARSVRTALAQYGLHAYLDVDDLGPGLYDWELLKEIEKRPGFILILVPGALDRCSENDDVFRREIAHAIKTERNIVPLIKDFPDPKLAFTAKEPLPPDIALLPQFEAVMYSEVHFRAVIEKLAVFLEKDPPRRHGSSQGSAPAE